MLNMSVCCVCWGLNLIKKVEIAKVSNLATIVGSLTLSDASIFSFKKFTIVSRQQTALSYVDTKGAMFYLTMGLGEDGFSCCILQGRERLIALNAFLHGSAKKLETLHQRW